MAATLPTAPTAVASSITDYAIPTGGTTHTPQDGDELTTLLSAPNSTLKLGDVIQLAAGTTYTGEFTFPNVTTQGSGSTAWIYVVSDSLGSLPAEGTRVGLGDVTNMPTMSDPGEFNQIVIFMATGAHNYRFVGIDFYHQTGTITQAFIDCGQGDVEDCHSIVFDRCVMRNATGGPECRAGLDFNVRNGVIKECYITNFFNTGYDGKAINIWQTSGPILISNNYLASGSHEILIGAPASASGIYPRDITVERNYFYKDLSWGSAYRLKNHFELKNAQRVLLNGNDFINMRDNIPDQFGHCIVLTPRNEEGDDSTASIRDVKISNNRLLNAANFISMAGQDIVYTSESLYRVQITNNLFYQNTALQGGQHRSIRIVDYTNSLPISDLTITHNTMLKSSNIGCSIYFDYAKGTNSTNEITCLDNIFAEGLTTNFGGVFQYGGQEGTTIIDQWTDAYQLTSNVIIGRDSGDYPSGNYFPANETAVKFTNYAGGDYTLASDSDYKAGAANDASDGTDMGADIAAIEAAINGTEASSGTLALFLA